MYTRLRELSFMYPIRFPLAAGLSAYFLIRSSFRFYCRSLHLFLFVVSLSYLLPSYLFRLWFGCLSSVRLGDDLSYIPQYRNLS